VVGLDSVHRRTDLYGFDANEFKPHRWDNKWKPETWTFYPFGRGHRPCLGKNLAMMEVKFVLCRLLQTFGSIEMVEHVGNKVVLVKAEERARIRTKMAFNTKPAEPVWLRFRQ
jgi:cytochrome P450